MQCLENLFQFLAKFISETFPSSCFKALYESGVYLIFYQQNIDKNAMLKNLVLRTEKFLSETFPK